MRSRPRSVLFERAIAASGYTGPSHSSMMTGLYPRRHSMGFSQRHAGARRRRDAGRSVPATRVRHGGVRQQRRACGAQRPQSRLRRLRRRIPRHRGEPCPTRSSAAPRRRVERALAWLARPRSKPFFLWVHFQDPHGPYTAPRAVRAISSTCRSAPASPSCACSTTTAGRGASRAYQLVDGTAPGERVPQPLRRRDRLHGSFRRRAARGRRAAFADRSSRLTADHGESFGENKFYFAHGHSAAPDLSHVPLILRARVCDPSAAPIRSSHVDIMPTLLELAGLPPPADVEGIALGPSCAHRRRRSAARGLLRHRLRSRRVLARTSSCWRRPRNRRPGRCKRLYQIGAG